MSAEPSFWSTVPGLLTGGAAVIAALTGLFAALHKAGVIGRGAGESTPGASSDAQAEAALVRAGGEWAATVRYDWGAEHAETFRFTIDGNTVLGTASFLGAPRGIEDGRVEGRHLHFVTRTRSEMDGESRELVHRYRATGGGNELSVVLQTTGGFSSHPPVSFVARRVLA